MRSRRASPDCHHYQPKAISSGPMVRTIIQLPEDQAAALARVARERGISKAALVREALTTELAAEQNGSAIERALDAAGSASSGVPDLAERHDDYLADSVAR